MKRIITALILIPVVLVLVFLGPWWQWLFTMAVAAVAALAAWEFLGLAENAGAQPPRIAVLVAILALFAGYFEWPGLTAAIFGILSLALLVYCTLFRPVEKLMADASSSIFCLLYIGFTLLALPSLRENPEGNGPSLLAFLLCVVWAGDAAALYIGRAWGRHKMAPTLSPNKTWEGALGSVAGSLFAAGFLLGLSHLLHGRPVVSGKRLVLADAGRDSQRRSTSGRSGRVRPQALGRRQGFRLAAPRPWRRTRPHRRPAPCRSRAVVRTDYSSVVLGQDSEFRDRRPGSPNGPHSNGSRASDN